MNILKYFSQLLFSILSRVHLVRDKEQFTLTVKRTKCHGTSVGTSEKGSNVTKDQTEA